MNYKYFENKKCEFYPCHKQLDKINCLFCFCPLYPMECWDKNCPECVYPHIASNWEPIIAKLTVEHLKGCQRKK